MMDLPSTFWPQTMVGWITVIGMVATALGGFWALAQQMGRLNGFGDRLNQHISDSKVLEGRMDAAERLLAMSQADRSNLHESVGRLATEMQALMKVAQAAQLARIEDLGEIRERLVRIETKVDRNDTDARTRGRE